MDKLSYFAQLVWRSGDQHNPFSARELVIFRIKLVILRQLDIHLGKVAELKN